MIVTMPKAKGMLPIVLTLAVLGTPSFVQAATPITASATSADQKIVLQYTPVVDIMYLMHWDITKPALPAGVDSIQTVPQENALLVHGTPAGRATVVDIVSHMDIKPRYVQLHSKLVAVSEEVYNKLGGNANKAFNGDTFSPADASMSFDQVALNTVTATTSFQSPLRCLTSSPTEVERIPMTLVATFNVAPRINSDNTITLLLSPSFTTYVAPSSSPAIPVTETSSLTNQLRNVKNGATTVTVIPYFNTPDHLPITLLYFVTATIIPDKS